MQYDFLDDWWEKVGKNGPKFEKIGKKWAKI